MRWLRERLDATGRSLQRLLVVADSAYCVKDLFGEFPERITLLARGAKNRAVNELPPALSASAESKSLGADAASTAIGRPDPPNGSTQGRNGEKHS
jgi:hypothetical protein